jgi:hypothetical protein
MGASDVAGRRCLHTTPICALIASASRGICSPSALMLPPSGAVSPRHIRTVVVLPAPFGPITPRHSPGAISKDRSSTTVLAPKRLDKCCAENSGVLGVGWGMGGLSRINTNVSWGTAIA